MLKGVRARGIEIIHSILKRQVFMGGYFHCSRTPIHTPHGSNTMHYGKIKKSIYWIYEKLTNRIDARTIYVLIQKKFQPFDRLFKKKKAATVINNGVAVLAKSNFRSV